MPRPFLATALFALSLPLAAQTTLPPAVTAAQAAVSAQSIRAYDKFLSDDMRIACGAGAIRVLQGQRSGKTVMSGRELVRGTTLAPGAIFTQSR